MLENRYKFLFIRVTNILTCPYNTRPQDLPNAPINSKKNNNIFQIYHKTVGKPTFQKVWSFFPSNVSVPSQNPRAHQLRLEPIPHLGGVTPPKSHVKAHFLQDFPNFPISPNPSYYILIVNPVAWLRMLLRPGPGPAQAWAWPALVP